MTGSARDARAASRASAAEEAASTQDESSPIDPETRKVVTEAFGVDLLRSTAPCGGQDSPAQAGQRRICVEEDKNREKAIRQDLFEAVRQLHDRVNGFDAGITEVKGSLQNLLEQGNNSGHPAITMDEIRATVTNANAGLIEEFRTMRTDVNSLMESRRDTPADVTKTPNAPAMPDTKEARTHGAKFAQDDHSQHVTGLPGNAGRVPTQYESTGYHPRSPKPRVVDLHRKALSQRFGMSHRTGYDSDSSDEFGGEVTGLPTRMTGLPDSRGLSFFERPKGIGHYNLSVIKPSETRFDRHMSYRYYRLRKLEDRSSDSALAATRQFTKRMEYTLAKKCFSGKDPIQVLPFLAKFVEEADRVGISEPSAYMVLDLYLEEPASEALTAARGRGQQSGVSAWPEAVNFLLATYATPAVLRNAVASVKAVTQNDNENEVDYGTRLRMAATRCGNAFTDAELLTIYIDGADRRIRPLLARYRENLPRNSVTLDTLVSFARDEGEAVRAQAVTKLPPRGAHSGARIHLVEHGSAVPSSTQGGEEMVGLIDGVISSQDTAELPSTIGEDQACLDDAVLYGEPRRGRQGGGHHQHVAAPPLSYENNQTRMSRPGWVNKPRDDRFICHTCYALGHTSLQCVVGIGKAALVVRNYEMLTDEQRSRVPRAAYDCAKLYLKLRAEQHNGSLSPSATAAEMTAQPNASQPMTVTESVQPKSAVTPGVSPKNA